MREQGHRIRLRIGALRRKRSRSIASYTAGVSSSSTPSGRSAILESGGGVTSRWYFPVSAPPARGEYGVNAKERSAQIDRTAWSSWGSSRL